MINNLSFFLIGVLLFSLGKTARAESSQKTFEIIDLSGEISGEPQLGVDQARSSWSRACADWKRETRDLNKANEMIFINCNTPSCSNLETGKSQCLSTGTYKIKAAGSRVNSVGPNPETETQAPPSVVTNQSLLPIRVQYMSKQFPV